MIRRMVVLNDGVVPPSGEATPAAGQAAVRALLATRGGAAVSAGFAPAAAAGATGLERGGQPVAVAMEFESAEAERAFVESLGGRVTLHENARLDLCDVLVDPFCAGLLGTQADMLRTLGLPSARERRDWGAGVNVVVVDNGIAGAAIPLGIGEDLGFRTARGVEPGRGWVDSRGDRRDHGTMVASCIRLIAPAARLWDCPLLPVEETVGEFAHEGYRTLLLVRDRILASRAAGDRSPWVIVNAWAVFNTSSDLPAGSPGNYADNPGHPLNALISSMSAELGVDFVFAAGNCGGRCFGIDVRCGPDDIGVGRSISGANSLDAAITVTAVTFNRQWVGGSSMGPGRVGREKPDLCVPGHFWGEFDHADGARRLMRCGSTSSASAVAGAVVAALRSHASLRHVTPAALKQLLLRTASIADLAGGTKEAGWDPFFGHGMIDPIRALSEA